MCFVVGPLRSGTDKIRLPNKSRGAFSSQYLQNKLPTFHLSSCSQCSGHERTHLVITETKSSHCGQGDWQQIDGITFAVSIPHIFNTPATAGQWEGSESRQRGSELISVVGQCVLTDGRQRLYQASPQLIYTQPAWSDCQCCQEFPAERKDGGFPSVCPSSPSVCLSCAWSL